MNANPNVGRLAPKAVSRYRRGPHHWPAPLTLSSARRSRAYRSFGFALLRDSLSFACPNKSEQRKGHRPQRRLTPVYSDTRADGTRAELGSLWRPSNMLRAPAQCAGHPSPLRVSVAAQRGRIQTNSFGLERPTASLPVFGPLGRSAEQRRTNAEKAAGCLSEASFRLARVRPEPRRASARSAGARQGVFSIGYFSLDKQREVPRASAGNHKPESTRLLEHKPLQARIPRRQEPNRGRP